MRYFLELSFNGKNYHGWQTQPNAVSVQATIESALSKIMRSSVLITGAGRTDTGVNARQMYAHFDTDVQIQDIFSFLTSLNSLVGKDIYIKNVFPVEDSLHARFDACERSYKYFVTFKKSPFLNEISWRSPSSLDIEKMNEAANLLLRVNDFTSFAKLHSDNKTNICDVREACWRPLQDDPEAFRFLGALDDGIVFTITADRFLRNMVRAIVGTLIEVGRDKLSVAGFSEIINQKNRNLAGTSMPPQALFLWEIKYPESRFLNNI